MKNTSSTTSQPQTENVRVLAYHFWQQANSPPEQALDFWLQAERQLTTQTKDVSTAKPPQDHNLADTGTSPTPKARGSTKPAVESIAKSAASGTEKRQSVTTKKPSRGR
jgi:hypothetical protein